MVRPMGTKVLIKPDDTEQATAGGIIRASRKIPNTGRVMAVSPDYSFDVAVGDRVHYSPNSREELEDGTILLDEQHIEFIYNE